MIVCITLYSLSYNFLVIFCFIAVFKFPRFIFFRAFIIFSRSQIFHLQVMFIPFCLLCAPFGPFRFKKQSVCKGDICFCKFKYGSLLFTVERNPHVKVEKDFGCGNFVEIRGHRSAK